MTHFREKFNTFLTKTDVHENTAREVKQFIYQMSSLAIAMVIPAQFNNYNWGFMKSAGVGVAKTTHFEKNHCLMSGYYKGNEKCRRKKL